MGNNRAYIEKEIRNSIDVKKRVLDEGIIIDALGMMAYQCVDVLRAGGKLLLCGNGGSASDAIHIAGEIVGRFQQERKAYHAVALNADIATMTAIANDYGYDQIFARQVEGLMRKGDILIGISTSGNSSNIIAAFKKANEIEGKTFLFSGKTGGKLKKIADICIIVPSDVTAHIQEAHECLLHILCGLIENGMIEKD